MTAQLPALVEQATQHLQLGQPAAARPLLERVLSLAPGHADALHLLAVAEQSIGQPDRAMALYRQLLAQAPGHAAGNYSLALLLSQLGQHKAALPYHDAAIRQLPQEPWAWINRGNSRAALRDFHTAIADYDCALGLQAWHPEALLNKGHALHEMGAWEQALSCHEQVLATRPDADPARLGQVRALVALRRFDAGLAVAQTLLQRMPAHAPAWCLQALCLAGLDRHEEALRSFQQALQLDPTHAQSWCGLGQTQDALDNPLEAEQSLRRAIVLKADYSDAWVNLGACLQGLGRYDEAAQTLEQALTLAPADAWGHWNLGLVLLRLGRFSQAWHHFEYRWQVPDLQLKHIRSARPAWSGGESEHPILLWGEQGIGDQILYASILPELTRLPQKKYVALDPRLLPLFARSLPGFEFIDLAGVTDTLGFAEQLPLGSLPRLLRPNPNSFTRAPASFLRADSQRSATLRRQISQPGKLVCGVSWSSTRPSIGRHKSLSLEHMLLPLQSEPLHFVDLQYGDTAAERLALRQSQGIEVQHIEEVDNFNDVDGLAALIQACDVVLTISNSTAHLAGALGKPTLLLLPLGKGQLWYWSPSQGRTPWYPSIRIATQQEFAQSDRAIEVFRLALGK